MTKARNRFVDKASAAQTGLRGSCDRAINAGETSTIR